MKWTLGLILLVSTACYGYTPYQIKMAHLTYDIGQEYGLGLTFTAIIRDESNFCKYRVGKKNPLDLGCGQIQETTVKTLLHRQVVSRHTLMYNDKLNLELSFAYLEFCFVKFHGDWVSGVLCYNKGDAGTAAIPAEQRTLDKYLTRIRKYMLEFSKHGPQL